MRGSEVVLLAQAAGEMIADLAEGCAEAGVRCTFFGTSHRALRDGVAVVPAPRLDTRGALRRLISWVRYLVRATFWILRQGRAAHLVLFTNPPLLPALGLVLRRQYTVVVYDVYPDLLERMGVLRPGGMVARLWRRLNRAVYARAKRVITLGPRMAENVGAERVTVISPWADTEVMRPLPKSENPFAVQQGQVGKLTVMYSGNMGRSHDVETMLAAAERLKAEPGIHFVFVGGGPKWELVRGRAAELPNITVLPWQTPEVFLHSMATADVAVVSLEPAASGLEFPSKTVSAMAAGAVILAVSRAPNDLELLVREHGCGVNVEPGDVEEFTRAVMRFHEDRVELDRCRRAARRAAERYYDRRRNVESYLEALGLDVAVHEACR